MPRAVRIHEFGGPEKLTVEDTNIVDPGPGEVLLRHEAAAVHFADVLVREGTYFLKPDLPSGLGLEGAGVIEAVGEGVTDFQPGDRAAYRFNLGAYSDARIIAADQIHALPDNVDAKTAVAGTVRGMTAQYLVRQIRYRPHGYGAGARRLGRDGHTAHPVVQASGRHSHWHGRRPRENGDREDQWLRSCD